MDVQRSSENSLFSNAPAPTRPLSAVNYRDIGISSDDEPMSGLMRDSDTRGVDYAPDDIEMSDAGPATAPSGGVVRTFFHDD